ncbi:MAG: sigma-70 family RNA polymerase sigma factor [Myxococcota bacterium]
MTTKPLTAEQRARVERCTRLVDSLARSIAPKVAKLGEDDLRSVGYEALVRCSQRYDPETGTSFQTFAYHRVRGAMLDESRRAVPGLRQRSRALRALAASQSLLERSQQREEQGDEDTRSLQQRVEAAAELVAQTTTVVMLASAGPRDPEQVADAHGGDFDASIDDARIQSRVRKALDECCNEDERAFLRALYDEGLSMSELGTRLGKHKSTVSRRHASLLARLSSVLAEPSSD